MKVAIPVLHEPRISAHFGRSPAFLVLTVTQGRIRRRELRLNDQASHRGDAPHAAHGKGHAHDHHRFVQLLGDCRAVVGLGMGAGARSALESAGIRVRILDGPCSPDEAALRYESGLLEPDPGPTCRS